MIKKILIALAVIAVLAALFVNYSKRPDPIDVNTLSAQRLKAGPQAVSVEKFVLVDASRRTPENGDFEGADNRTLEMFVWTPTIAPVTPQPLVIYSHGFMSSGDGGEYLGKQLASRGYTVAAATYPLTSYSAPGGANPEDVLNQPGDISFIIDNLLAYNADVEHVLYNKIDASRVAAVGMSMGGMTTEMVAYHPQMSDHRIGAAVSIAGPAYMFSKRFFAHRNLPFMMIASPQDALINYTENAADIMDKIPGAYLVSVQGASHIGFSGGSKWLRWFNNPDSLGCRALLSDESVQGEADWYSKIGGPEIGVLPATMPTMCQQDPLPEAMNPIRQLEITSLAVSSFLDCQFSDKQGERQDSCDYLQSKLAKELPAVSVAF